MSRLRALACSAGLFWLLAIAGCGINPQPEPPSMNETNDDDAAGGGGAAGSGGSYGAGGHQAATPDGSPDVPPGSHDDAGNGKRSGEFATEDPSANTDHNGAFGNFGDAGTDAGDAGADRAVADEADDSGRELPPIPDAGLGSVMQ